MNEMLSTIWGASDYTPTARRLERVVPQLADRIRSLVPASGSPHLVDIGAGHGELAQLLCDTGYQVTAIEPASRMRETAAARGIARQATWSDAVGEATGLEAGSVDGIVSNFGAFMCRVPEGPAEWARILKPGAPLVFSAWDNTGFLSDMTDRMLAVSGGEAPHLHWREHVHERLGAAFDQLQVDRYEMPWEFESVEAAIEENETGSPVHAFMMSALGERAGELREALRTCFSDYVDPSTGRVRGTADYLIVQAQRAAA